MLGLFNDVLRRKIGKQDLDIHPRFSVVGRRNRWDGRVDLVHFKLHLGRRTGVLSCGFHYCTLVGFACRRGLGIVAAF